MIKTKWYNNSIEEKLIKDTEQIPEGFVRGRLPRPKKIDSLIQQISKEKLYQIYIIENTPFHKLSTILGITDKDVRILLSQYKIKKDLKCAAKNNSYKRDHETSVLIGKKSSITQKNNWKNKSDEEKQQWSNSCREVELNLAQDKKIKKSQAYRDWWLSLSDSQRKEINIKRSATMKEQWAKNGDNILSRMKKAEKENRKSRLCRSVAEQKLFDVLVEIYPDTIYDIKVDDRYPYFCDFYIPSEDLFIELNAHPSHGRLPLHKLSVDEYSQYPQRWLNVFAMRDIEKQTTAKNNKLKYIMIYPIASLQENLEINDFKYSNLVEKLYQSQK